MKPQLLTCKIFIPMMMYNNLNKNSKNKESEQNQNPTFDDNRNSSTTTCTKSTNCEVVAVDDDDAESDIESDAKSEPAQTKRGSTRIAKIKHVSSLFQLVFILSRVQWLIHNVVLFYIKSSN